MALATDKKFKGFYTCTTGMHYYNTVIHIFFAFKIFHFAQSDELFFLRKDAHNITWHAFNTDN